MELLLQDIGKQFNRRWLFSGINLQIKAKSTTAIIGSNGSGKSTFIQMLYNYQTLSAGKITYIANNTELEDSNIASYISFAAPYLELPEEFTLNELIEFHFKLKSKNSLFNPETLIKQTNLAGNEDKLIKHFSSGMKQKVKLILTFCTESSLLLLDEPCANLDLESIQWYRQTMQQLINHKTIVIASNMPEEYDFCEQKIDLRTFSKQ